MKTLFIIAVLVVITSCKKEIQSNPDHQNSIQTYSRQHEVTGWFYTGAYFPSDEGHNLEGFSAIADYQKLRLTGATMRTFWIAAYYSVDLSEGQQQRWIQFGYINDAFANRIFSDVFNISGPQGYGEYSVPNPNYFSSFVYPPLGSKVEFKIYNSSGTLWRLAVNGSDLVELDLQTTILAPTDGGGSEIMTESQDAMTFPDEINVSNVSSEQNGVWSIIPTANVKTATWPIEGHNQNATLAIGEFNMGGSKGTIYPTPTQLW
jgi:hypothetical protein